MNELRIRYATDQNFISWPSNLNAQPLICQQDLGPQFLHQIQASTELMNFERLEDTTARTGKTFVYAEALCGLLYNLGLLAF